MKYEALLGGKQIIESWSVCPESELATLYLCPSLSAISIPPSLLPPSLLATFPLSPSLPLCYLLHSLHHNLIEHLNAEIVLHTITDVSIALDWLHSTFFYIRVRQNPTYYSQSTSSCGNTYSLQVYMTSCVADFPEQKDRLEGKLQGM